MAKNLIVIIADTFRADHLGCYGNARVKTPRLDKLAAEGVTFTNCYADGLPTIPCRRVFHTGKSIVPMKVHGGWIPLQPGRRPVGRVLSSKGFTTGFIADTYHHFKPGLNFHQGYSSWEWIRGQESDAYRSGPREKFDPKQHMPEHLWNENYDERMRQYLMNTQDFKGEKDYFCAASMRAGLRWLKENAGAERFMLWIDTFDPHEPWDAPPKYQKMYRDDYGYKRFLFGYGVRGKDIKPEDYPLLQDLYAAEVSFVDHWVGHLVDGVRKLGLLDDTAIVFSTDHGTHLGEEGCVQKTAGLLNSCVAQLPLIVRHPDQSLAGKRVDALTHATDYMPSFLDMLDIEHKLDLDGESFLPLMTGEKEALHEYVITEFGSNAAVRDLEWHYYQDAKNKDWLQPSYVTDRADKVKAGGPGVPHLYDLENDPEETNNVVLENAEVVAKMQGRLRELYGV
ncbi:MAG: sulfatase [Armatimonadota bacterium]